MAGATFDVRTHKSDGSEGQSFGPFLARGSGCVTHLGLLEPPRDGHVLDWSELVLPNVEVVLPRLEFPPHGRRWEEEEGEEVYGRWVDGERCTCFDDQDEELDMDYGDLF